LPAFSELLDYKFYIMPSKTEQLLLATGGGSEVAFRVVESWKELEVVEGLAKSGLTSIRDQAALRCQASSFLVDKAPRSLHNGI
jgi:hypothetical protein